MAFIEKPPGVEDLKIWKPVEEAKWSPVPKLGPEWMSKWSVDEGGYWVMLTDGCALWGETKAAKYIQEKSEDWAPCLEAEVKKLSRLMLLDLSKLHVRVQWGEGRQCVVLHVSSTLNDLAYRWEFNLTRLSDELFRQHWIMPLLVQVHSLDLKVKELTTEVEQKRRQLKDLLPDNSKLSKPRKKKDTDVKKSVEAVVVGGAWSVLQDHLEVYPSIMKHLTSCSYVNGKEEVEQIEDKGAAPTPTPLVTSKKPTEEEEKEEEAEREKLQRAKIQEIQHGPVKQNKQAKKRKWII